MACIAPLLQATHLYRRHIGRGQYRRCIIERTLLMQGKEDLDVIVVSLEGYIGPRKHGFKRPSTYVWGAMDVEAQNERLGGKSLSRTGVLWRPVSTH